jgi:membrane associated rhomboid family serine protease
MKSSNQDTHHFRFTNLTLALPLYFVLSLWLVFWFEVTQGQNFNEYGIYPRSFTGLRGLIFSPFIHGDVKHLYQNSFPLFVLFFCLMYFYKKIAFKVFFYGTLLTGLLTWIIARPSFHIGASGIIYMLFSFIFFSGVFRRNFRLIAVSLMIIFLYGSMVWYLLPVKASISWEGHLSGFLVGILFAFIFRKTGPQKIQYDWEKPDYQPDEFDRNFDENGIFIDPQKEE